MIHALKKNGKQRAEARIYPHPAWFRFFEYAQDMGDGVVSRLVIRDRVPVFMESIFPGIDLTDEDSEPWEKKDASTPKVTSEYSPEWTKLVRVATEMGHCEFIDLEIKGGVPVSIGKLVNKERLD